MALITDNTTKIKFYTGAKASYNEATHGKGVYFCNDFPLIHANGVWTGVSDVQLTGKTLKIKIGDVWDKTSSAYVAQFISVSLADIVPNDTQIAHWNTAYNFVSNISGTDTDTVINKWQEIIDFLEGISSTTDLSSLLAAKANSSTKVIAGTGLTGGGALTKDVTISLATAGTAGTYVKVTTDQYGRVTSGQTTIAISDVSSLQTTLDAKVPTTRKIIASNPLSVDNSGVLSKDLTLSLKYVSGEFKVETSGSYAGLLQLNAVPQSKVTGLTDALNAKLVASNIKGGNGIGITTNNNDVTVSAAIYSKGAISILSSGSDTTDKGLAVAVDNSSIYIPDASNALAIKSISSFVVNGLNSDSTTKALSANQGKILNTSITNVSASLTNLTGTVNDLTDRVDANEACLTWVVVS